jgi:hypothetical protein
MSKGHDFDRMSRRLAFSKESCGLTEIFAHSSGVFNATSAQYRLFEYMKLETEKAGT